MSLPGQISDREAKMGIYLNCNEDLGAEKAQSDSCCNLKCRRPSRALIPGVYARQFSVSRDPNLMS